MLRREPKDLKRRRFGNQGKAWLTVETTEEGNAYLRELSLGGDSDLEVDDLVAALDDHYGIVDGLDHDLIGRILEQARREPEREYFGKRDLLVASDVPARHPVDGRIDYKFLSMMTRKGDPPYRDVRAALKETQLRSVLARDLTVIPARPGDELATKVPPAEGADGRDIFGNTTVRVASPRDVQLRGGTNVDIDGDVAIARTFGYVCVMNGIISVISPIWVSPDRLEAHYIHFPHATPQVVPHTDWVLDLLETLEFTVQPAERTLAALIRNLAESGSKRRNYLLVRGRPPSPGRDAYLECSFAAEGVQEAVMTDGKVDVEALRSAVSVKQGQLIATVVPPAPGEHGADLFGNEIESEPGQPVTFEAGENVFTEEEDGAVKFFYAKIDGNAHINDTTLSVHSVLRVDGDVDAASGDIVAGQDVEISGSVREGAKINAAGSVTVLGVVEGGAAVSAKGDILIAQGVLGQDTKIIALGNVETKFVRDSSIMAREDVTIADHCHNANVRAGRELTVQSGASDRGGSIVGGTVQATTRLTADVVGSATSAGTVVGIASDITVEARLKKATDQVEFCDANILRMFRTLGIQSLDAKVVEALLKRTPPWRKQPVVQLIMKLRELVTFREDALKQMEAIQDEKNGLLDQAEVVIGNRIYADSVVDIGFNKMKLTEDVENAVFSLAGNGVVWETNFEIDDEDQVAPVDEDAS